MLLQSIRRFAITYLVPLCIAGAGILLSAGYGIQQFGEARSGIIGEMKRSTSFAATQSKQLLDALEAVTGFIALSIEESGRIDRMAALFEIVRRNLGTLKTIVVIGPDGIIQDEMRQDARIIGLDVSEIEGHEFAVSLPSGRLTLGKPTISRIDGELVFPLTQVVRDDDDALLGLIVTVADGAFFADIRNEVLRRAGTDLFLTEPDYGVMSHLGPGEASPARLSLIETAMADPALSGLGEAARVTLPLQGNLIFAERLRGSRLHLLVVRSMASIRAEALAKIAPPVVFGLIFSMIAAIVVALFQHKERQLSEGDKRLTQLAENLPGTIHRYLLHPDGSDRIEGITGSLEAVWGVTPDEVEEDAGVLWNLILPEDLPAVHASVTESAETLGHWSHRWRIRQPSGEIRHLQSSGMPERLADGTISWNAMILDVTDLATAEHELERNREMFHEAQKRKAIGDLTGGVAHDFNNLLAVIKGNVEIIESIGLSGEVADLLEEVRIATDRSAQLTRQLLLMGRNAVLEPKILQLNEPVVELERLLRRTLPETIEVECVLAAGLWSTFADPAHVQSALLNLALNARDAMAEGGHLTLETANVRLGSDYADGSAEMIAPGRYVMLSVSDTGEGMRAEVCERAFDPYFTTKERGKGSGLGLSVVQGFMKQSGGVVRIHSEPGAGTAVKLFFPVHEGEEERRMALSTPPAAGDERILLVEDEPAVRKTIARQLGALGYSVVEASNGLDAVKLLQEVPEIRLVLTDIVMPGALTGPQLVREIRKSRPELPAILMSGYPEETAMSGGGIDPQDLQLMKPISMADLARAIRSRLARAG